MPWAVSKAVSTMDHSMMITDNAQDSRFEATVGDQMIGRKPHRRYSGHIVLTPSVAASGAGAS